MPKYASYYAPINQALQNLNNSFADKHERDLEFQKYALKSQLAHQSLMAAANDPVNKLKREKARYELEDQPINVKSYMPSDTNMNSRMGAETVTALNNALPSLFEGRNVKLNAQTGYVVDEMDNPISLPRFKARQINNRLGLISIAENNGIRKDLQDLNRLQYEYDQVNRAELPGDLHLSHKRMKLQGIKSEMESIEKRLNNPHYLAMEYAKAEKAYEHLYANTEDPHVKALASARIKSFQGQRMDALKADKTKGYYHYIDGGVPVNIQMTKADALDYQQQNPNLTLQRGYRPQVSSAKNDPYKEEMHNITVDSKRNTMVKQQSDLLSNQLKSLNDDELTFTAMEVFNDVQTPSDANGNKPFSPQRARAHAFNIAKTIKSFKSDSKLSDSGWSDYPEIYETVLNVLKTTPQEKVASVSKRMRDELRMLIDSDKFEALDLAAEEKDMNIDGWFEFSQNKQKATKSAAEQRYQTLLNEIQTKLQSARETQK